LRAWFEYGDDTKALEESLSEAENRDVESVELRDLPAEAVESGVFETTEEYYGALHEAAVGVAGRRTEEAVDTTERNLINAVRTLDTLNEQKNLLGERVRDWRDETTPPENIGASLDGATDAVDDARNEIEGYIEETAPEVAPNLSNLAGERLAARLVALAGGLEELARMPSSTVQVLGAEDALFRHLSDGTPPPKHGVIYVHPYVRETQSGERGSAARALAGKLTIAARVDCYAGDLRPYLADELDEKVERIRDRTEGGS